MNATPSFWVCCQLGAREHYAVPRALQRVQRLGRLITDAWTPRGTSIDLAVTRLVPRLGQRYHPDLATAPIDALTSSLVAHEAWWRVRGRREWELILARNRWFQRRAAAALPSGGHGRRVMVFAHSYAARDILAEARRRGWTTVLGQIDPGPEHYRLQERLSREHPAFAAPSEAPPARYFEGWRHECELADHIVVNSDWSRQSITRAGVPATKVRVLPLPYEPEPGAASFVREYPDRFSRQRPLRALFVGSASVTKGVAELLQSITLLDGLPVELRLVGHRAMKIPRHYLEHPQIHWRGPVDRATVMDSYRTSDVLIFPSHSDGFGMAQVEARGWSLPIIASRNCGDVVRDRETGILLNEVTPVAIAAALREIIDRPQMLEEFSRNAAAPAFDVPALGSGLAALETV